MSVLRNFCDWDQPALDRAVELLTAGWKSGPLDLRDRLVIVPTRNAGRRLRERLAQAAARRGTGVLVGHVETPPFLFRPAAAPQPLAAGIAAEVFWRRVFAQCNAKELASLSPSAPASAGPALATHLVSLRNVLCEEGYTFGSFNNRLGKDHPEPLRWACLAALERTYLDLVEREGWRDDVAAKIAVAERPALPDGVKRITVLFTPDPAPLALRALEQLSRSNPVDIAVHAPASLANAFDEWGRPRHEDWEKRELSLDPSCVEVCDDVTSEVERVRAMVEQLSPDARSGCVVGVGDSQTVPRIAMALGRDGVGTFDPSGTPASRLPVFSLVDRLLILHQDRRAESLFELMRHPYALRRLERDLDMENVLLGVMDEFQNQQMPVSFDMALETARRFNPARRNGISEADAARMQHAVSSALQAVKTWMDSLSAGSLGARLLRLLETIFMEMPSGKAFEEEARLMADGLQDFLPMENVCAAGEKAEMLSKHLASKSLTARRGEKDLDLLGWLELGWEDAPTLLITDLNDGVVPDAIVADAFLPDGVRAQTNMRDNRKRLARDAYLLETLVRSRATAGRIRGFTVRRGIRGDPLKPSRLLFQGPVDGLADRALYFFSDGPPAFRSAERVPGWRFQGTDPASCPAVHHWSASKMKTYLECPFKYYLRHVIGLNDPFEERSELDPPGFGNIVHDVFRDFARAPVADSRDPREIEPFLHQALDRHFEGRFGAQISLPLEIQRGVLRQRLSYAAHTQAVWRQKGWRIVPEFVERPLELEVSGERIQGRIDRVDVHEQTHEVCVIDYKTSSDADKVQVWKVSKKAMSKDLEFMEGPVKGKVWIDLQLPIYIEMCRPHFQDAPAFRAAHFLMPNAVSDTVIQEWKNLDAAALENAMTCARRIIERIRAGVFWPPRTTYGRKGRSPEYRIFFDDIERHSDEGWVRRLREAADAFHQRPSAAEREG